MQSKIYNVNQSVGVYGFFDDLIPVNAQSVVETVQTGSDGKYSYMLPGVLGTTSNGFFFNYDDSIPHGATINSIVLLLRVAKNYAQDEFGTHWFARIYSQRVDAQDNVVLPEPSALVKGLNVEEDNWLNTSSEITSDEFTLIPSDFNGQLAFGFRANVGVSPSEADTAFIDKAQIQINFTLPAPSPSTPTIVTRHTNRLDVSSHISVVTDGQSPNYPITYYWQWTDFDPSMGEPKIIYTGETQTLAQGNTLAKGGLPVDATIPLDFSYTDRSKQLVGGKTYWVRLVAMNADNTVQSDWMETSTLLKDVVVI